jgi:adenine-specific DNA-methyltransferase
VTGSNEFFVLRGQEVEDLGLAAYTVPLVSRSVQLSGARITGAEWQALSAAGGRVHLLHLAPLDGAALAPPLARYVAGGESRGLHQGYKCSIRAPWYAVPAVWVPDGFVFRQIYDFPRFVRNAAAATSTDTIHRLTCTADPEAVIENAYTHLTAASAEIEGRSYGGGVLELEPTEAERLLVPARLEAALPLAECDRLVRAGRLAQVLAENDRLILAGRLGLARADCAMLREIWVKLRDRRIARRRRRLPRAAPPAPPAPAATPATPATRA